MQNGETGLRDRCSAVVFLSRLRVCSHTVVAAYCYCDCCCCVEETTEKFPASLSHKVKHDELASSQHVSVQRNVESHFEEVGRELVDGLVRVNASIQAASLGRLIATENDVSGLLEMDAVEHTGVRGGDFN